ncbi:MAG TPA: hypothetical protein VF411_07510, partial [Bacteroidia bacterium]
MNAFAQNADKSDVEKLRHDINQLQAGHKAHENLRNAHQTTIDSLREAIANLQTLYQADHAEIKTEEYQLGNETSSLNQLNDYTLHKFMRYHSLVKRIMLLGILAFVFLTALMVILYIIIKSKSEQAERNFTINTNALLKMTNDFDTKIAISDKIADSKTIEISRMFINQLSDTKSGCENLVNKTKEELKGEFKKDITYSFQLALSQLIEAKKETAERLALTNKQVTLLEDEFNLQHRKMIALEDVMKDKL